MQEIILENRTQTETLHELSYNRIPSTSTYQFTSTLTNWRFDTYSPYTYQSLQLDFATYDTTNPNGFPLQEFTLADSDPFNPSIDPFDPFMPADSGGGISSLRLYVGDEYDAKSYKIYDSEDPFGGGLVSPMPYSGYGIEFDGSMIADELRMWSQASTDSFIYVEANLEDIVHVNDSTAPLRFMASLTEHRDMLVLEGDAFQGDRLVIPDFFATDATTISWYRNGVPITDQNNRSYNLTQEDVGQELQIWMQFSDPITNSLRTTLFSTGNLTIHDVNDAPIGPTTPLVFSVMEDATSQTVVGSVATKFYDIDPDDTLRFSLSSEVFGSAFGIDETTGDIIVLSVLDYETKPEYIFNVTASDKQGAEVSSIVTIAVQDVDEMPMLEGDLLTYKIPALVSSGDLENDPDNFIFNSIDIYMKAYEDAHISYSYINEADTDDTEIRIYSQGIESILYEDGSAVFPDDHKIRADMEFFTDAYGTEQVAYSFYDEDEWNSFGTTILVSDPDLLVNATSEELLAYVQGIQSDFDRVPTEHPLGPDREVLASSLYGSFLQEENSQSGSIDIVASKLSNGDVELNLFNSMSNDAIEAFDFTLHYDSAVFEYVGSEFPEGWTGVAGNLNAGKLPHAAYSITPVSDASANIAAITLRPTEEIGSTVFSITDVFINDTEGTDTIQSFTFDPGHLLSGSANHWKDSNIGFDGMVSISQLSDVGDEHVMD
ncbi:MAG: hypothetical protein EBT20_04520, partial [Alphaproteobacteria bacterium]|nr:hypothetical protein [Alphaproteobacteria bacterium]